MDGASEFFANGPRVFGLDARDEQTLFVFVNFGGDFQHLLRGFARAIDDFGKTFPQSAVGVHLREPEIGQGRGLKGVQDFLAAKLPSPKLFQQLDGFGGCHAERMPHSGRFETLILAGL